MSRFVKGSITPNIKFIIDSLAALNVNDFCAFSREQFNTYKSAASLRAGIWNVKNEHLPGIEIECRSTVKTVHVKRIQ